MNSIKSLFFVSLLFVLHDSAAIDQFNPFKKTGIPTMDQHGTLVKLWETGIQKIIQHNSFIRETTLPEIRRQNSTLLEGNEFLDPALHQDASPEIQHLGKEAQEKLGITIKQQVPIKLMKNNDPFNALAKHNSTGIFIKNYKVTYSDDLTKDQDDLKRSFDKYVLYHETAHRKYWDSELNTELLLYITGSIPIILSSFYLLYAKHVKNSLKELIPNENQAEALQFIGTCLYMLSAAATWAYYTFIKYPQQKGAFIESRADYTALQAIDCHICASNISLFIKSQNSDEEIERKKEGYFCKEDIQTIAERLRTKNRICDYHMKKKQPFEQSTN